MYISVIELLFNADFCLIFYENIYFGESCWKCRLTFKSRFMMKKINESHTFNKVKGGRRVK